MYIFFFFKKKKKNLLMAATHLPVPLLSNKDSLPWIVQKFGGTSVGKFLENITDTIVRSHLETHRVALVCSARSGETKEKGTTNRLLRASEEALIHGSKEYN
jgi:aspartokinase